MKSRREHRGGRGLRLCARLALLFCLAFFSGGAETAGPTGETVTGYFADHTYLRPAMKQTTDSVDVIPPYTVVTLQVIDETWAQYTGPKGKTGYVKYARIQPEPEYEPEEERYVYGEKRIGVRSLPIYDSPTVYTAAAWELLTVDGHWKGYLHVRAGDGTGGYILPDWARRAEFTPEPIRRVTLCVREETPLLDMPLAGAHEIGRLTPDRLAVSEAACGSYYALTLEDGRTAYAEKTRTAVLALKGGESRIFFTLPRTGGVRRTDYPENIYANAAVRAEGARLMLADGGSLELEGNSRIYVYMQYGQWLGVVSGQQPGYLLREDAEILTGGALMARLKETDLSGGSIRRNELLDQAFTMVEEGNPFQARYNLLTGAEVKSLFSLGVPYFWGGRNTRTLLERLPLYTTREAWQSSPVFYHKGTIYLYGYDCVGFVRAVYSLCGKPFSGSLSDLRSPAHCAAGEHIYCDNVHPLPEDWTEAASVMQVGDIMVLHHPGNHVMMFMGTLRQYGYTEEQLPALAKYLDYPLMLQAGENPYYYLRFQSLIETSGDPRTAAASPTDGGVCVCILGVPKEDAELVWELHDTTKRGFDVEGSCVTIMGFGSVKDYFVYRRNENPPVTEETEGTDPEEEITDDLEAIGDEEAEPSDNPETTGDEEAEPSEEPEGAGDREEPGE